MSGAQTETFMANIIFMSWNIEKYGSGKYIKRDKKGNVTRTSPNKDHLINTIVKTAIHYNVNLLSILEICKGCASAIIEILKQVSTRCPALVLGKI